jgi:chromosome partitioning protein
MRTLAVLSQKGGTGKTTLAIHLAVAAWAGDRRVLIADLDPQRSASDWRRARLGPGPGLIESKTGALFVAQQASERAGVDLMVLDTRPSADGDTAEAIRCADLCLIVLRPSFLDLKATARMVDMTQAMGKTAMFVLNQAPSRRGEREGPSVMETVEGLRSLGLPLAPVGLRARAVYQSAVAKGLTATETAPDSAAAREISLLWEHVENTLFLSRSSARRVTARPRLQPAYAAMAVGGVGAVPVIRGAGLSPAE